MGNVEIKDRARKPHSIFGQRQQRLSSRSPLKDLLANSPYRLSPIRYSPVTVRRKSQLQNNTAREDTSVRKSPIRETRPPVEESESRERGLENREKCQEIIRKVRNFNDFLVQLKKKLREESGTIGTGMGRQRSEVSLSVKLENEKVELEKYKKLVERELSKTHSIENITIQNAQNGEKILTIQYEEPHPPMMSIPNTAPAPPPTDPLTLTGRLMEMARETQRKEQREGAEKRLKQARAIWTVLVRKTRELKERLDRQQSREGDGQLRDYLALKEQVVKLQELSASIQSANRQSVEIERKIREMVP